MILAHQLVGPWYKESHGPYEVNYPSSYDELEVVRATEEKAARDIQRLEDERFLKLLKQPLRVESLKMPRQTWKEILEWEKHTGLSGQERSFVQLGR